MNCTLPLTAGTAGVTVAVNVTKSPGFDGDPDVATAVVVGSTLTPIVAVAGPPPRPEARFDVEAWIVTCPAASELGAGVKRRPAAPCAIVVHAPAAMRVTASVWTS